MKKILILRHGKWQPPNDQLSVASRDATRILKENVGEFDLVYSSSKQRTIQTAQILSGKNPLVDSRAGILNASKEQMEKVEKLRDSHPLGVVGILFSFPELQESLKVAGNNLLLLIKEIFTKLPENGRALVVSHDGTIISLEKIIKHASFENIDKTYQPLGGFWIDEQLQITPV